MQQTKPQQEDLLVWFLKVWDQIEDNYIPILIGVGIALIAALIFVFFHQEHTQRARDAREALGSVYIALSQDRTADAIATSHDVMATYAGEAAAAEALMTLANLHFEEGDIAEARTLFQRYLDENSPEGPLGYGAWSGLASCLETEGKFAEAGQRFAAFADAQPNSPYAAIALKEAGRCYELAQQPTQASDAYQKITAEYSASSVARFARGQLNMMGIEAE